MTDTNTTIQHGRYWFETRRPFCNLMFLLPMLLIYEIGVWLFGGAQGDAIRNGADAWLRLWLARTGIMAIWLPPVLLLGTFLAWHVTSRQPWKMSFDTFGGMIAESLLYAFLLILIGQITDYGFRRTAALRLELITETDLSWLIRFVSFMGAGIYEEFVFRLCFLSVAYYGLRGLLIPQRWATIGTFVLSSLVFSLAHYLEPNQQASAVALFRGAAIRVVSTPSLWFSFLFRSVAGMIFAALYFLRGFGITVGAHATYDVFVGLLLVTEI